MPLPAVLAKEIGPVNQKRVATGVMSASSYGLSGNEGEVYGQADPSTCHETGSGPAPDTRSGKGQADQQNQGAM